MLYKKIALDIFSLVFKKKFSDDHGNVILFPGNEIGFGTHNVPCKYCSN